MTDQRTRRSHLSPAFARLLSGGGGELAIIVSIQDDQADWFINLTILDEYVQKNKRFPMPDRECLDWQTSLAVAWYTHSKYKTEINRWLDRDGNVKFFNASSLNQRVDGITQKDAANVLHVFIEMQEDFDEDINTLEPDEVTEGIIKILLTDLEENSPAWTARHKLAGHYPALARAAGIISALGIEGFPILMDIVTRSYDKWISTEEGFRVLGEYQGGASRHDYLRAIEMGHIETFRNFDIKEDGVSSISLAEFMGIKVTELL